MRPPTLAVPSFHGSCLRLAWFSLDLGATSVGETQQFQRSVRPRGLVKANRRKIAQNSAGQRRC
jgi:hypothetical protein